MQIKNENTRKYAKVYNDNLKKNLIEKNVFRFNLLLYESERNLENKCGYYTILTKHIYQHEKYLLYIYIYISDGTIVTFGRQR